MKGIDWTEIQTVIAVARLGSLSAAARELLVNHSTILRRVQSFEQKHRVRVFVREHQGYKLSRHGRALLQDFDQIDQVMIGLQRRIVDYDYQLEGRLTVTSTENLFRSFLKQSLFEFASRFPRLELDLLISNHLVDMPHLEADIAIRPMNALSDGYFGIRLFEIHFYFYAPIAMGGKIDIETLSEHPLWIGYSGALANARAGQLLLTKMNTRPTLTANSFDAVAEAASAGLGIALLPSFIGEAHSKLTQIKSDPVFKTDVYAMAPKDLSVSRKVNALLNFLGEKYQPQ